MKKSYLLLAAAAMALGFTACSSEDSITEEKKTQDVAVEEAGVGFDAYIQRSTTRSGANGTMTYDSPTTSRALTATGFGVFGYYTDNNEYDGQTIPNFFYNQEIKIMGSPTYWGYTPVKYWPNEYGNSAIAEDNDKVSFFAYAPYVDVNVSTGKAQDQTYGITQLSRNSATGDPYVKYIASFDWTKNVDLLWGTVPSANTSWSIVAGETQTLAAGMPWLNVQRPTEAATQAAASQRVKFQFGHALAKLNVQIDYDADATNTTTDNVLDETTRVYVRSVTFTGFSMKGALNLNNTEANIPLWYAYDAQNDLDGSAQYTLNDGRKDGREGASAASAEENQFLNQELIQKYTWNSAKKTSKGVTATAQNLFAYPGMKEIIDDKEASTVTGKINASTITGFKEATGRDALTNWEYTNATNAAALTSWPIMVIPNGEEMTVTIVYDVETVDANLATTVSDVSTHGSSIQNTITKTITFNGADKNYLEAGKKYTLKLHLGLNSVKFSADVTGWDTTPAETDEWLPYNKTSYQAPGSYDYYVSAGTETSSGFQLTGFAPNEVVSATKGTVDGTETSGSASAAGILTGATITGITANTSVVKIITDTYATFTGATSGKAVNMNLVQAAAQPAFVYDDASVLTFSTTTGTFTLKNATGTALTGSVWTGNTRNVTIVSAYRNGIAMTEVEEGASPSGNLQFKTASSTDNGGTITLGVEPSTGETFVFTIKAGDAEPVTITYPAPVTPGT